MTGRPHRGRNRVSAQRRARPAAGAAELVELVDASGHSTGSAEKQFAHRFGLRHRAFSIFLVDEDGLLVMQQRHPDKYHSGGLWANACCGHPRPAEQVGAAAARRLDEELGVGVPLQQAFCTEYYGELDNGLIENEKVTVFFGRLNAPPKPDPREILGLRHAAFDELVADIVSRPQLYAYWLKHYFKYHGAEIAAHCRRFGPSPGSPRPRPTDLPQPRKAVRTLQSS